MKFHSMKDSNDILIILLLQHFHLFCPNWKKRTVVSKELSSVMQYFFSYLLKECIVLIMVCCFIMPLYVIFMLHSNIMQIYQALYFILYPCHKMQIFSLFLKSLVLSAIFFFFNIVNIFCFSYVANQKYLSSLKFLFI